MSDFPVFPFFRFLKIANHDSELKMMKKLQKQCTVCGPSASGLVQLGHSHDPLQLTIEIFNFSGKGKAEKSDKKFLRLERP